LRLNQIGLPASSTSSPVSSNNSQQQDSRGATFHGFHGSLDEMRYTQIMKSEIKSEVLRLIEKLPEDATWQDLEYAMYIRQVVAAGVADLDAGRTHTSEEIRQMFNLPPRP
jgi:predicted transcriptional regulator